MSANRVPPHLAGDTSSANLLTDARLADIACRDRGSLWMPIAARLAREVQASRKLRVDLLRVHSPDYFGTWCRCCEERYPCPTVRLIEEAERG